MNDYGVEFYDEDDEEMDDDEREAAIDQLVQQRLAEHQEQDERYWAHVANHVAMAEEALGQQFTPRQIHQFVSDFQANDHQPFDVSHIESDLSDDDERREYMAEQMESISAENEGDEE